MKVLRQNLLGGPYWKIALAGITLGVCLTALLTYTYRGQAELRVSALNNFRHDLEKHAAGLSYFYSERKNDLKNLPTKREISIFFENKALGMSMDYGLRASLIAIQESLNLILKERMLGEDRIYTRFVFVDSSGKCLIDTQRNPGLGLAGEKCGEFLTPGKSEPVILVKRPNGIAELIVSCPYFFKGAYSGQLVAWISTQTVQQHLIGTDSQFYKRITRVYSTQDNFYLPTETDGTSLTASLPALAGMQDRDYYTFKATSQSGTRFEMISTWVAIKDTPLYLVGVIPAVELFGYLSPTYLLIVLSSLLLLSLLGGGVVWWTNTRNVILRTRLEEAAIREQEIGKKNVQLEGEIAERKLAEKALRESEEKYRGLIETTNTGYVIIDSEGKVLDANPEYVRLTGYNELKEILGHRVIEWTAEQDRGKNAAAIKQCFQTGLIKHLELDYAGRDGQSIPVEINATALSNSKGVKFLSLVRDISDRKRVEDEKAKLEAQLVQAQKMEAVGTLAGGIAHDFNNILTAIIGNLSLAMTDPQNEEYLRNKLNDAERACLQAQSLSRQLLIFAKGGAPIKGLLYLVELITEAATFASIGSQVRCEFSLPDGLWAVQVDSGQISQVFQNLVINAIQAMPTGGRIKIRGENLVVERGSDLPLVAGSYIKISIQDQGTGISADFLSKIFDPYFTTKQTGSGLGLATVYSIIKSHQGHIAVESKLGAGTTFFIYLPAVAQEVVAQPEEVRELLTGQGKILVMDDEDQVRRVLGGMLSRLGYEADFAGNGALAIKKFVKAKECGRPFDAVILDLTVPGGMGGQETIKKLLKIDPLVKSIVSSGYSEDPIMSDFQKYGFCEVIAKPYRVVELSKILQKVINIRQG